MKKKSRGIYHFADLDVFSKKLLLENINSAVATEKIDGVQTRVGRDEHGVFLSREHRGGSRWYKDTPLDLFPVHIGIDFKHFLDYESAELEDILEVDEIFDAEFLPSQIIIPNAVKYGQCSHSRLCIFNIIHAKPGIRDRLKKTNILCILEETPVTTNLDLNLEIEKLITELGSLLEKQIGEYKIAELLSMKKNVRYAGISDHKALRGDIDVARSQYISFSILNASRFELLAKGLVSHLRTQPEHVTEGFVLKFKDVTTKVVDWSIFLMSKDLYRERRRSIYHILGVMGDQEIHSLEDLKEMIAKFKKYSESNIRLQNYEYQDFVLDQFTRLGKLEQIIDDMGDVSDTTLINTDIWIKQYVRRFNV